MHVQRLVDSLSAERSFKNWGGGCEEADEHVDIRLSSRDIKLVLILPWLLTDFSVCIQTVSTMFLKMKKRQTSEMETGFSFFLTWPWLCLITKKEIALFNDPPPSSVSLIDKGNQMEEVGRTPLKHSHCPWTSHYQRHQHMMRGSMWQVILISWYVQKKPISSLLITNPAHDLELMQAGGVFGIVSGTRQSGFSCCCLFEDPSLTSHSTTKIQLRFQRIQCHQVISHFSDYI